LERKLPVKNSTLHRRLTNFSNELILFMMAATRQERIKRAISNYFTRLRNIRPAIGGKDLLAMGYKPGPIFKEVLQLVLDAKLDGRLKSRKDELAFAKARLSGSTRRTEGKRRTSA
jgi:tRNA nucleotidyltransferase (CCA-adding enzyme)